MRQLSNDEMFIYRMEAATEAYLPAESEILGSIDGNIGLFAVTYASVAA